MQPDLPSNPQPTDLEPTDLEPTDLEPSNLEPSDLQQIGNDLKSLEAAIEDFKARYAQVQADEALRDRLHSQRQFLSTPANPTSETAAEALAIESSLQNDLKTITEELDAIEMRLESRLLNWLGMRQYFWQVVRFTGLGLVLGWGLHSLTIESRTPRNPSQDAILERQQ